MSRIGNRKIEIPEGISVEAKDDQILIRNSNQEKSITLPECLSVKIDDNYLVIERKNHSKRAKSLHGTYARIISNVMVGLSSGFVRHLEFKGVGFTVSVVGNKLVMRLGFSHPVEVAIPQGLEVTVQRNVISIKGNDKNEVGQFAAKLREIKKPEVYKGKGIKYQEEHIRKKAGKAAQSAST